MIPDKRAWGYLSVTFYKRQTWKPYIAKAEAKARRKPAVLRKLAGDTWEVSEKILLTVYQGTVIIIVMILFL